MRHPLRLAGIVAALAAAACTTSPAARAPAAPAASAIPTSSPTALAASPSIPAPTPPPAPAATPTPAPAAGLTVAVTSSDYGFLAISTTPGAACTAKATLSDGTAVADLSSPRTAGSTGTASWTYFQRPTKATGGVYAVTCQAAGRQASATASFGVGN